jgi:PIN domain-containing protein
VTLAEHYSIRQDETVDDVTWPADIPARGWLALAKEERIRRRPAEKAAVRRHGAPLLYLTRGDLPAGVYVERILAKLEAITRACAEAGPCKTRGAATATAVKVAAASRRAPTPGSLGPG